MVVMNRSACVCFIYKSQNKHKPHWNLSEEKKTVRNQNENKDFAVSRLQIVCTWYR